MTASNDLVARLRKGRVLYYHETGPVYEGSTEIGREAADRIEALEADLAEAHAQTDRWQDRWQDEHDRIEALEDALRDARSALRPCVTMLSDLLEEHGAEIPWDGEDAFRRGEWFEESDVVAIGHAEITLARIDALLEDRT